ncbi:MAG: precorrin-6A/cobalt-precorrin-6A reductase [Candidatus Devosia symbiotica]|nr:precorrin-6A/cobalt-precorrin-6A reductase [Candidatus Devosia symbiotica]
MRGNCRVDGLVAYLRSASVERLVDATHLYAGTISANPIADALASSVPLVRLNGSGRRNAARRAAAEGWIACAYGGQCSILFWQRWWRSTSCGRARASSATALAG